MSAQGIPNNDKDWKVYIAKKLDSLDAGREKLKDDFHACLTEIKVEIATLKVKSSRGEIFWGLLGGFIPASLIVILWLLRSAGQL